jgi:hypothetical protein
MTTEIYNYLITKCTNVTIIAQLNNKHKIDFKLFLKYIKRNKYNESILLYMYNKINNILDNNDIIIPFINVNIYKKFICYDID